jgi:hypothetical protein
MVVAGSHYLPEWEASGLMGIGDAKAADVLRRQFRKLHLREFPLSYANEIPPGQTYTGTLLCVGGPDTGPTILEAWKRARTSFEWVDPERHDLRIRDKNNPSIKPYEPGYGLNWAGHTEVVRDYGLIVRAPNPFAQKGDNDWILLFAGCFGYGTLAAVKYAVTEDFVTQELVHKGHPVECLLSVDVVGGAPQRSELLDIRPLPDTADSLGSQTRG